MAKIRAQRKDLKCMRTYAGKPTKWEHLKKWNHYKTNVVPEIVKEQVRLLLEGKLSTPEFTSTFNIEGSSEWKWIEELQAKANEKEDPIKAMNQINIETLANCMERIDISIQLADMHIQSLNDTTLEETPGYKYNQKYGISQEDLEIVAARRDGFGLDDLDRMTL